MNSCKSAAALCLMTDFLALAGCSAQQDTDTVLADADLLAGIASVIDGDTIGIHGQRIRLDGFDSPERGSRCASVNVYQKAALFRRTAHSHLFSD